MLAIIFDLLIIILVIYAVKTIIKNMSKKNQED